MVAKPWNSKLSSFVYYQGYIINFHMCLLKLHPFFKGVSKEVKDEKNWTKSSVVAYCQNIILYEC